MKTAFSSETHQCPRCGVFLAGDWRTDALRFCPQCHGDLETAWYRVPPTAPRRSVPPTPSSTVTDEAQWPLFYVGLLLIAILVPMLISEFARPWGAYLVMPWTVIVVLAGVGYHLWRRIFGKSSAEVRR